MNVFALRLRPNQDLLLSLHAFVREHQLKAAFVMTCVGSLRRAALRLADQEATSVFDAKFEIVSLVGTLDAAGSHLHLALADGQGSLVGGHVMEGCLIYTTAELVIGEIEHLTFSRVLDPETTYEELQIAARVAE